jgi:hypothetical protein
VRVNAVGPHAAVERLGERVVRRFAGAREVQGDALRISPHIEIARDELTALIDPKGLRIADPTVDALRRNQIGDPGRYSSAAPRSESQGLRAATLSERALPASLLVIFVMSIRRLLSTGPSGTKSEPGSLTDLLGAVGVAPFRYSRI